MTRTRRRPFRPAAVLIPLGVAFAGGLSGCGISPVYEVRVVNESAVTVVASISNTRNIARVETLARVTVRPGTVETLGPVEGVPLDPIELQVSRPEEMQSLPERTRLGRGVWTATVSDGLGENWNSYTVRVEKGRDPG